MFPDKILAKKRENMYKKLFKIFAVLLMVFSMILLIFESLTGILSLVLCQKLCPHYVVSSEPQIVDYSCGFNTDMYLNFSLVLLFIFGIVLNILSFREVVAVESHQ